MRIVLDLQAAQSANRYRRIGRYSLQLAKALARRAGKHELLIALNGNFAESIEPLRQEFSGLLPPERIVVFRAPAPVAGADLSNRWRARAAEEVRLHFINTLAPDLVHVSNLFEGFFDDAVCSIDSLVCGAPTSLALHDLTPVTRQADYVNDDSARTWYVGKMASVRRAALVLTPSEASRREAISFLRFPEDAVVDVSVPADEPEKAEQPCWDASAARVLEAFEKLHELRHSARPSHAQARRLEARPRLAYVSPLPDERTGIAYYSAELLPELSRHYEIEVVTDQPRSSLSSSACLPVRSVAWFRKNAQRFERIVYQFGNSPFHSHMFELLERHRGIVALHDFYLGDVLHFDECNGRAPNAFLNALFEAHGWPALAEEALHGRNHAVGHYPCSRKIFELAQGVIVHSKYARDLALKWYGRAALEKTRIARFPRARTSGANRAAARERLGLADQQMLVCSFGHLARTKMNERLVEVWAKSPLASDRRFSMVFVGQPPGDTGLESSRAKLPWRDQIQITGFVPPDLYHAYLNACDLAVQLRTSSRGETSAAVLDVLAQGLPLIANLHGFVNELPRDAFFAIPDQFDDSELTEALAFLSTNEKARRDLSRRSAEYARAAHDPAASSEDYRAAIEYFARTSEVTARKRMYAAIRTHSEDKWPSQRDLARTAESIASNFRGCAPPQLLVDISVLVQHDLKTGIERVVRAILTAILRWRDSRWRVEPVYRDAHGRFRYARRFTADFLGIRNGIFNDNLVEARQGDTFLGLELNLDGIANNEPYFRELRDCGVSLVFVLYDLLPILHPEWFPESMDDVFKRWLNVVTRLAAGVVCISNTVAKEFHAWLEREQPPRHGPLCIGHFRLGADIEASAPTSGVPEEARLVLHALKARPTFLVVGTMEPRKGHALVLNAFECLWQNGLDVNLVLVGKHGWMVDGLARKLRDHNELGARLFWLEGISDELLQLVYGAATALIMASEGEGCGLPLLEAARRGIPIIARDIPVFREVAEDGAFYFNTASPLELANRIREWLCLHDAGLAPSSMRLAPLTWQESAESLMRLLIQGGWDKRWSLARAAKVDPVEQAEHIAV